MWITRLHQFTASEQEYLEKRYLKILRNDYGLSTAQVREAQLRDAEVYTQRPTFRSWLEAEEYALTNAQADPRPISFMNQLWNFLLRDVMQVIPRETGIYDAAIYIGEVPNPNFNAEVINCGSRRFLILVHMGLALFLYRLSRVLIASMRLRLRYPGKAEVVLEPEMDMPAARLIVMRNLQLLFRGGHEMPIPLRQDERVFISASYTYALEQFVIAHELGHILQSIEPYMAQEGQSNAPKRALSTFPQFRHPWNQELLADAFATNICHGLIDLASSKQYFSKENAADILLEAPYIVFRVMDVLERFATTQGLNDWQTHPPAILRRKALLDLQRGVGVHEDFLAQAEERWAHLCELTDLGGA